MTKSFPVLLASLLAVSSVSAPLQVLAQEAQPLDRIAAVVDEDVILQSELQRAMAFIAWVSSWSLTRMPLPWARATCSLTSTRRSST